MLEVKVSAIGLICPDHCVMLQSSAGAVCGAKNWTIQTCVSLRALIYVRTDRLKDPRPLILLLRETVQSGVEAATQTWKLPQRGQMKVVVAALRYSCMFATLQHLG